MVCHHSPEMSWKVPGSTGYIIHVQQFKTSMVGIITPASSATVAGKPKLGSMNCKRPQGEQEIPLKDLKRPSHLRKVNNSSHSPHQRAPLFGAPSSWFIYRSDATHSQHFFQVYPAAFRRHRVPCGEHHMLRQPPGSTRPAFCKDFEDVPVAGPAWNGSSAALCSFICFPEREGSDLVGQCFTNLSGLETAPLTTLTTIKSHQNLVGVLLSTLENFWTTRFHLFHKKTIYWWM